MARLVALWCCKCGTTVKVVAEANFSSPAKQMAACPKCHHERSIGADKIISVTADTFDTSPSDVSPCQEKERLLVVHDKALHIYLRGPVGAGLVPPRLGEPAAGLQWVPSAEIPCNGRHSSTTQA